MPSLTPPSKPPKQIFLHLGVHKTGSTFLQTALDYYVQQRNATCTVVSPRTNREICLKLRSNIVNNRNQMLLDLPRGIAINPNSVSLQLDALRAFENNKIIISDENLLGPSPGHLINKNSQYRDEFIGSLYPTSAFVAEFMTPLMKISTVKIIFYIRRQDRFIESVYRDLVGQFKSKLNFSDFVDTLTLESFDWNQVLEPWVQLYGQENVEILPFEQIQSKPADFLNYFLRWAEIRETNETLNFKLEPKNIGISDAEIEVARHLTGLVITEEQKKLARRFIHQLNLGKKRDILWNDAYNNKPITIFCKANEKLAKKYPNIFDSDTKKYYVYDGRDIK